MYSFDIWVYVFNPFTYSKRKLLHCRKAYHKTVHKYHPQKLPSNSSSGSYFNSNFSRTSFTDLGNPVS